MNDDFKKIIFRVLAGFLVVVVVFLGLAFIWSCGFDFSCSRAKAPIGLTPIPTLMPATLPAPKTDGVPDAFGKCEVKAMDLLGAWVDAGYPESDPFPFTDTSGNPCGGTFSADVWPLLNEANLWFPASLSCTSCHSTAFEEGTGGVDLSSYAGILAGSGRESVEQANGNDILGGGDWIDSILFQTLNLTENIPDGHPPLTYPAANLVIYAGSHVTPSIPMDAPPATAVP